MGMLFIRRRLHEKELAELGAQKRAAEELESARRAQANSRARAEAEERQAKELAELEKLTAPETAGEAPKLGAPAELEDRRGGRRR